MVGDWVHIKENFKHKYTFCENNVHFSTVKKRKEKGLLEKYTLKEYNSELQAFMVTKIYI